MFVTLGSLTREARTCDTPKSGGLLSLPILLYTIASGPPTFEGWPMRRSHVANNNILPNDYMTHSRSID